MILASITDSTKKQYESALKLWWNFNIKKGMNPYSYDIPKIIEFLTEIYNNGASYGSLNSIRSALSLLLGSELGVDPTVKRFFRGVSKLRPARPRYNKTWQPSIVLQFLSKWFPHNELDLQKLSKKLITLIALITAHRVQTLSCIRISNILITKDQIEIMITDPIKTTSIGKKQPLLIIPFFSQNPKICPAKCLSDYMNRTKPLRKSYKDDKLFISYKNPHEPVCSQTLSKWIKETLEVSGIDTKIFSGHSTRHAATSAAYRSGVSIDIIRNTAGWSESSQMFATFYNRPIIKDNSVFAKSLLNY